MATTIRDVAKRAGVSVKTVSRVLNDEPMVNPGTRAHVQKIMARLGYTPNVSARRLARGQALVIGLLFDNVSQEYFNSVLKGSFTAARDTGYGLLTIPFSVCEESERRHILHMVAERRVDGFIFTPPCDNHGELLEQLARAKIPFVRLSPHDRHLPYPHVRVQDYEGAVAMTEYLVKLGHKRIGLIMGTRDHSASHERLRGFRETLKKHKIKFDPALVCQGDWTFAAGISCGRALLALSRRPTAIFASNDDMAAGVLYTAHQHGIRVPEQLTVTGFDDVPLAQQIWPSLTTVHQPIQQLSQLGTRLLIDLIRRNPLNTVHYDLPTQLVVRDSAAVIPSRGNRPK
jgi:LacI family transcriptional regulator